MKRCPDCGVTKPLSEFGRNRAHKNGVQGYCKGCTPERSRWAHLKSKHNMDREMCEHLLDLQDHACAICYAVHPGGRGRFHVDHDHRCCAGDTSCAKCWRGLLCGNCNLGLGLFLDDPTLLSNAARYVAAYAERTYVVS